MSNYDARVFSASPQAVEALQRSLQESVDTTKLCCGECDFYKSAEGQCLGDKRKRKVDMAQSMCPVGRAHHLALKEVFDLRSDADTLTEQYARPEDAILALIEVVDDIGKAHNQLRRHFYIAVGWIVALGLCDLWLVLRSITPT